MIASTLIQNSGCNAIPGSNKQSYWQIATYVKELNYEYWVGLYFTMYIDDVMKKLSKFEYKQKKYQD